MCGIWEVLLHAYHATHLIHEKTTPHMWTFSAFASNTDLLHSSGISVYEWSKHEFSNSLADFGFYAAKNFLLLNS